MSRKHPDSLVFRGNLLHWLGRRPQPVHGQTPEGASPANAKGPGFWWLDEGAALIPLPARPHRAARRALALYDGGHAAGILLARGFGPEAEKELFLRSGFDRPVFVAALQGWKKAAARYIEKERGDAQNEDCGDGRAVL